MSTNYLEEKERLEKISSLCSSIEWHRRSMKYTLVNLIPTEEFEQTLKKFEKIVNDLSELDTELKEKAGWK